MPEIDIRQVTQKDTPVLNNFEHGYYSQYVWQMGLDQDAHGLSVNFRRVRLPRRVMVSYPRSREEIFSEYEGEGIFLAAELNQVVVGYIKVALDRERHTAWIRDLIVSAPMRRQGIASGLIVAVINLLSRKHYSYVILALQAKNDPAIKCVEKIGFSFSGFRDHYFSNGELALFYHRFIR